MDIILKMRAWRMKLALHIVAGSDLKSSTLEKEGKIGIRATLQAGYWGGRALK